MGCWGFGIMESDAALDAEEEIYRCAGLDSSSQTFSYGAPRTRAALEQHFANIDTLLAHEPVIEGDTYYRALGYHVFAVLLMRAGCALSETQRQLLLDQSAACSEFQAIGKLKQQAPGESLTEAFMQAQSETLGIPGFEHMLPRYAGRYAAISNLIDTLRQYNITGGQPVSLHQRGLLDVFADKLAGS